MKTPFFSSMEDPFLGQIRPVLFTEREGDGYDDYFPKWSKLIMLCYFLSSSLLRNQASSADPSCFPIPLISWSLCVVEFLFFFFSALSNWKGAELNLACIKSCIFLCGAYDVRDFYQLRGDGGWMWWLFPQMIDTDYTVLSVNFLFVKESSH